MPFRGPLSPRRRSVQSPSFLFHDSSSDESSTSIVQRPLTELVGTPLPLFPDYLNETADPGWDVALAVTSILENIPAVPLTLITPLTQVLDVVSGIRDAVKTMRDEKDECTYLLLRVLKFLHSFVDGLKGRNTPDDTPMASSLFTLKSNLMAIYADATRWSRLHLPKGSIQRDKIMTEISMHGDNLTDCLHTFQIITSITVFYPLDRVETITFPDPSVSARPLAPSERTPVSDPSVSTAV
ncbi:hypothetical protein BS47DRAFT_1101880 [Hydnum rufescens UP504]|uniref:Uncharacterized protein n=1 Tax=Hydnum rufescens UP504 TaxID=1448309 RepID=A0A9P6AUZ4_9AGAM|nr:hypothetical protein BS47DRAFT_1101880 [Hydnum rufescens UP504]